MHYLLERAGVTDEIGIDKFLWSADQAIKSAGEVLARSQTQDDISRKGLLTGDEELEEMPLGVVTVE